MGASSTAWVNLERNSSWTDSWTMTVPREVQRWPAVPKPENRAPSTARSRSASGMTTRGFLPPSSRQGDCMCLPQSSPILFPTSEEPVKPTLSTSPSSRAFSSPSKAAGPSACTTFRTPSGRPPAMNSLRQGVADGGRVLGGLPHHGVAAGERRYEVPRRYGDGEVARRDDGRDTHGDAESEELLVRHLRWDRLAVEAAALAGEEVAGVYDLLHLAERFRVGFAYLTGNEARERLLVVLDDASDLLDDLGADRGRHRGPLSLRLPCRPASIDERPRVAKQHLGHLLGRARRVRRGHASAGSAVGRASPYHGGDGTCL